MKNSTDPDQKPTDLAQHCLQIESISKFCRTRIWGHVLHREICVMWEKYENLHSFAVCKFQRIVTIIVYFPLNYNLRKSFSNTLPYYDLCFLVSKITKKKKNKKNKVHSFK